MTEQEDEVSSYVNNGPQRSRNFSDLKREFTISRNWTLGMLLKVLNALITNKPRVLTVSDEHGSENAIYTATNVLAPPQEFDSH